MRWNWIEDKVKRFGWTHGAELGIKEGRTIGHLLETCPELFMYGVDRWSEEVDEGNPETYAAWNFSAIEKQARQRVAKHNGRATLIKGSTEEAAAWVPDGTLDFVFIDADHGTEAVRRDVLLWRPKLVEAGWLIGHDINWPTVKEAVEALELKYKAAHDNIWYVEP